MNTPIIKQIHGATVCLYPMKEVEAVTAIARFHAGSWYEKNAWGAHHLLEHVMLDGGKQFPTEEKIELFKEENGLVTNGATGGDLLEFYFRAPKLRVAEGLTLLFDALNTPLLSTTQIEKNKTVIAQEYKDKWSNPHIRYGRAVNEQLYGKTHPYTRDGMGEMNYVESLNQKQLKRIHTDYCVTQNLVLVVVGNFQEEELLPLIRSHLEKMPQAEKREPTIPPVTPSFPYFYWKEDVMKVNINIYWHTAEMTDNTPLKERLAVNLGRYILGGSSRSRLFKELRTNKGWVYNAFASKGFLPTLSWFAVHTSTDSEKAQQVYEILLKETQKFITHGIPEDEFQRAKNYLNMQTLINYDSVGAIAGKLMEEVFFEGKAYLPEELNNIVDTISREEVIHCLEIFFKQKPSVSTMAKEDPKLLLL